MHAWPRPRKKAIDVAVSRYLVALGPSKAAGAVEAAAALKAGEFINGTVVTPGGTKPEAESGARHACIASLSTPTEQMVRSRNGTLWSHSCKVLGG